MAVELLLKLFDADQLLPDGRLCVVQFALQLLVPFLSFIDLFC